MTNKELLERCAKVMGSHLSVGEFTGNTYIGNSAVAWNPLTSVADAADMAIKMKVNVVWVEGHVVAGQGRAYCDELIKDHPTDQEAYCYAVCSVVAQMGGE